MNEAVNQGPLTFEDVVKAVGETDPNSTNANKIRVILGRGSFGTIQGHLNTLRAAKTAAEQAPHAAAPPPAMPAEIGALWVVAYGVATAAVRERLDKVVQERDALTARITVASADAEAAAEEIKALEARALQIEVQAKESLDMASKAVAETAAELVTVKAAAQTTEARLSHELEEARHAAEVENLKAQAAMQALQSALDRQVDQLADFKSALHKPEGKATL